MVSIHPIRVTVRGTRLWNFDDYKGPSSATRLLLHGERGHQSAKPPSSAVRFQKMGIPRNEIQGNHLLVRKPDRPPTHLLTFQGKHIVREFQGFVKKKWEMLSSLWQDFPPLVSSYEVQSVSPLSFSSVFSSFFCFFTSRLPFNIFLVVPYSSKHTGFPCFFLRMHLLSDTTIQQHDKPQNIRRSSQPPESLFSLYTSLYWN